MNPDTGRRPVTFNMREGFVDQHLDLPCGKCIGCRSDQGRYWAVRMYHEASLHERNCFVTLTYDDNHCPEKLDKRDLQKFFKRLRHKTPLRYFACGEYGSKTRRPHYHAVFFGVDFLGGSSPINEQLYTHPEVLECWGKGLVSLGSFTLSSAMYVAGYAVKKLGDDDGFTLMSRRPGIGHNWLDKFSDDLCRTGSVTIEGQEFPIPPRYFDWSLDLDHVKSQRVEYVESLTAEDKYRNRVAMRAREHNLKARYERAKEKL